MAEGWKSQIFVGSGEASPPSDPLSLSLRMTMLGQKAARPNRKGENEKPLPDANRQETEKSGPEVLPWPHGMDPAEIAALYDEDSTHHACVNLKAAALLSNGYKFVNPKGKSKVPPAMIEEFEAMFPDGVEDFATAVERDFWSLGNAWIEVVRNNAGRVTGGAASGRVAELRHVPARTMWAVNPKFKETRGSYVQVVGGEEVYFRAFGDVEPASAEGQDAVNELVHLKNYTPYDSWYGIPPIWAALCAVLGNRLFEQHAMDYLEDRGLSRYLLVMDGAHMMLDEKDEAVLNSYINGLISNRNTKLILLGTPSGTSSTVHALRGEVNFDTLDVVRTANRDSIARVHNVPPRLLGIIASGALGGASEGDVQFEYFKRMCVRPRQKVWSRLFQQIFFGQDAKRAKWTVEFNELDIADFLRLMQANVGYIRSGVLTVNQVLSSLGHDGIGPAGDRHIIIAGGTPTDLEQIGALPAAAPGPGTSDPGGNDSRGQGDGSGGDQTAGQGDQ